MISPARSAAFRALVLFRRNNRIILPHCNEDVDRHLAERIYYGVLQNERFLDFCLAQLITRGFRRLHPAVLDLLRLSAYQILFLDRIPDSAVVNDAVELCRKASYSHHAGLVNAVLRKLSGHRDELMAMSPSLAVRFSHPDWMVTRLTERYGEEFTEALLKANQSIPALRLQINTDLCTARRFTEYLKQNGVEIISVNDELCSVLVASTAVEGLPGYREGLFYIQDDAARISVHLAGITRGMDVLDACAAPGGKSIATRLKAANRFPVISAPTGCRNVLKTISVSKWTFLFCCAMPACFTLSLNPVFRLLSPMYRVPAQALSGSTLKYVIRRSLSF